MAIGYMGLEIMGKVHMEEKFASQTFYRTLEYIGKELKQGSTRQFCFSWHQLKSLCVPSWPI